MSIHAGRSDTGQMLIAARLLQGVAAGMLMVFYADIPIPGLLVAVREIRTHQRRALLARFPAPS